jgi:peroxiredoxin
MRHSANVTCNEAAITVPSITLRVGQMLPDIELVSASGGSSVTLRSARGETNVVLWRHAFECAECDRYLDGLTGLEEEFRVWDARLLVLASSVPSRMPIR